VKKAALAFAIVVFTTVILISFSFSIKTVEAANAADYSIQQVDHKIEVMYNGYILINDTIRIVGNASQPTEHLNRFLIGFPYKYGSYVLHCVAYDASGIFNVTLNVPLENHMGFYAVEIIFPQPLDISNGTTHNFTVGFILSSNLLNTSDTNSYILDFPAYPSLTKTVTHCSVAIVLPGGVTDILITKDDGLVNRSTYVKENLSAFTYSPANVTFSLTDENIQLFDINELKREVRINEIGEIGGSDSYRITSKAPESKTINFVEIILPLNASNISAQDQFGGKMSTPVRTDEKTNRYRINFTLPLESYKSTIFTVKYYLPNQAYINTQERANNLNVQPLLFQHVNYYFEQASVTFVLPEGARVLIPESTLIGSAYRITRGVFQETVTINSQGISYLESAIPSENALRIVYEYNPLWLSFRPTLWMWALTVVGCAVAVVWKRPKAPARVAVPSVAVRLSPDYIKSFVDAYKEKRKIILELESLEVRVRKGKIPRRRYKVQRKTLETHLNTLSRNLTEFKEKMRAAGGHYADLMRQLEIAETEINEVEANIKSIEARHSRGELSLEAHRKLLADYQHRKERAETTINGILLRLREEIR